MTKYCSNCKIEVDSGKFCPECGTKLEDIPTEFFCPECGKVYDHGKFCPECGVKFQERKKIEDTPKTITSDLSPESCIVCPVCGYENPAGSKECAGCGFPLESTVGDNSVSSDSTTESEDESILAKYTDENGDLRHLNEEEVPLALEEINRLADNGNPKAEVLLAALLMGGEYVKEDWQRAYDLVCDAETRGYAYAAEYKAVFYYYGIVVDRDVDLAERLIEPFLDHTSTTMFLKGQICMDKGNEVESVKWFQKSAERDNPLGLLHMGYAYLNGVGNVPQDLGLAFDYFSRSAALGDAEAENMLGVCYQNGQGTEPDEEQALYWYQEAVKHNDPNAQNNLANCYKKGELGLEADPEKAFKLYKKAAAQDNVDAMFEVAEYYNASYLTAQKSVKWYRKAANAGHSEAMFELAQKYENGWNVEQDSAKAKEYYEKAAEAGCERAIQREEGSHSYMNWLDETGQRFRKDTPDDAYETFIGDLQKDASNGLDLAQKLLGNCYFDGKGVKVDKKESVKWFRKAAEQGNMIAQFNLGYCYCNGQGVRKNYAESFKWFSKAAEQGYADAQNNLGICFFNGRGVLKDYGEAVKWYKTAAEQGNKFAQNNLGNCYYNGQGVTRNYREAVKWYKKSAAQGNADAQCHLGNCYYYGSGVPQDSAKAQEYYTQAAEAGHEGAIRSLKGIAAKEKAEKAAKEKAAKEKAEKAAKEKAAEEKAAKEKTEKAEAKRKKTQPWAEIASIRITHHIWNNGVEGMNFLCSFVTHNMKGKKGSVNLYFYDNAGEPLKDFNKAFCTSAGEVATHIYITPESVNTAYIDLLIFFPYSELHLSETWKGDIKYSLSIISEGKEILSGDKTKIPFDNVLKTLRTKTVKFDRIWYEDLNSELLVIHTKFSIIHALNEDGRIAVWFYNSKGMALKAKSDEQAKYKAPDGQVTVQLPIKPKYESTLWNDVSLSIPYSALNLAGEYVHDIKFRVGVMFGETHLPYADYVVFKVEVKRGLFSGIKYRLIK